MITPFQRHKAKWSNCELCPLHKVRKHVVLIKGKIPCDVLFVGEGPGQSEDVLGIPFVGPAGKLLDKIISRALRGEEPPRMAFINLVACIPKAAKGDPPRKSDEPSTSEIKACSPRVDGIMKICRPRTIVCVGKVAEKQGDKQGWDDRAANRINIIHPSAILQADDSVKGLYFKRATIQLSDAFEALKTKMERS